MDFVMLASSCAPDVHVTTLQAIVRHESGFDPLAIGVNGNPPRTIRPKSRSEATEAARRLMAEGKDFDAGYGQINVRNWSWLGLTPESVFDPCANLRAAQRVLADCYERASKRFTPGQPALRAAFSCYNTGDFVRGFDNGYVAKVVAGAGLRVPELLPDAADAQDGRPRVPEPRHASQPADDGFAQTSTDAFAATRSGLTDAFALRRPHPFGLFVHPVRPVQLAAPARPRS